MKLFDINGDLVQVDVRGSKHPIRGKSKSKLQGITGKKLEELYPYDEVLEEFTIPGSQLRCDFFLPKRKLVVEVGSDLHQEFTPFFHGDKTTSTKFSRQVGRDMQKHSWCEINEFKLVDVLSEEDLEKL